MFRNFARNFVHTLEFGLMYGQETSKRTRDIHDWFRADSGLTCAWFNDSSQTILVDYVKDKTCILLMTEYATPTNTHPTYLFVTQPHNRLVGISAVCTHYVP